jgi:hypothetical protein|nr:MAG TPA: tail assembly chaperone protein [Caudoviricetes sp.]
MEKNTDLQAFLKGNAKPIEDIEMIVSKRFIDNEGKPIPWVLRQLTGKESNNLRKKHTKKIKNKLGRIEEQFNSESYQEEFITNSVAFPDLTNSKLQESYGALGAYDLLQKMLSADELANLQIKVSGFAEEEIIENSMDNLVEEAKN